MIKNKKIFFSLIAVFFILVFTGMGFYFYRVRREVKQNLVSSAQTKISIVNTDNAVKLYLSNNQVDKKPAISAFQIHLKTTLAPDEYELKINPILQNQNWTFPLVKKETGELKVSGFRMGSTPYEITDSGILFFTLVPKTTKDAGVEIIKANTLFYDSNAQPTISYTVVNY